MSRQAPVQGLTLGLTLPFFAIQCAGLTLNHLFPGKLPYTGTFQTISAVLPCTVLPCIAIHYTIL